MREIAVSKNKLQTKQFVLTKIEYRKNSSDKNRIS